MITLQAINKIIGGDGTYEPGAIFKCKPEDAVFLLKKGAAREVSKKDGPKIPDSKEKTAAMENAEAKKIAANILLKKKEDEKVTEKKVIKKPRFGRTKKK